MIEANGSYCDDLFTLYVCQVIVVSTANRYSLDVSYNSMKPGGERNKLYYYLHFADKETEAQSGSISQWDRCYSYPCYKDEENEA